MNKKSTYSLIGMLSGTSLDGIDVGLFTFQGSLIEEQKFKTYPFPKKLRKSILENLSPKSTLPFLCEVNFSLGECFANACQKFIKEYPSAKKAVAIASHGQTFWHQPKTKDHSTASTLQLGEPSLIASITQKPVISDFRSGEIASGGEGAPLAPYFDFCFLRSKKSRLVLNIGGISNFSLLPPKQKRIETKGVISFDCGTGNVLLDKAAKLLFNQQYDKDGKLAKQGSPCKPIIKKLYSHPYFKKAPPKSTGRELFSDQYFQDFLTECTKHRLSNYDIMATLTEFTVQSIYRQHTKFASSNVEEVIVSGGGALNSFLMERLQEAFHSAKVFKISQVTNVSEKSKEAALFALLGYSFLLGKSASMKTNAVLGKLSLPPKTSQRLLRVVL